MPQASTSVYGIRIYHNNSVLTPHVDRLPLVSSAIINVAQDVDEDWFLEVYDHNGVGMLTFRTAANRLLILHCLSHADSFVCAAHNVTMEPGDLVLYESHSVIHGRPFKMKGNFYANIFVHFEPLGLPLDMPVDATHTNNLELPPYIIPGSSWEPEWRATYPDGWSLLKDPIVLVQRGDLRTLQYIAKLNASKLHEDDGTAANWRPIHEAARLGNTRLLKFLIEEGGADVNQMCNVETGMTPLDLAHMYVGSEHESSLYLASVGGVLEVPHPGEAPNEDEIDEFDEEWPDEETTNVEGSDEMLTEL